MKEIHLMQAQDATAAKSSPPIDLGDLMDVGFVATFSADGSGGAFQLQVSQDGTNWADKGSTVSGANAGSSQFDAEVRQRYARVSWDGSGAGGTFDLRATVKEKPIIGA